MVYCIPCACAVYLIVAPSCSSPVHLEAPLFLRMTQLRRRKVHSTQGRDISIWCFSVRSDLGLSMVSSQAM